MLDGFERSLAGLERGGEYRMGGQSVTDAFG